MRRGTAAQAAGHEAAQDPAAALLERDELRERIGRAEALRGAAVDPVRERAEEAVGDLVAEAARHEVEQGLAGRRYVATPDELAQRAQLAAQGEQPGAEQGRRRARHALEPLRRQQVLRLGGLRGGHEHVLATQRGEQRHDVAGTGRQARGGPLEAVAVLGVGTDDATHLGRGFQHAHARPTPLGVERVGQAGHAGSDDEAVVALAHLRARGGTRAERLRGLNERTRVLGRRVLVDAVAEVDHVARAGDRLGHAPHLVTWVWDYMRAGTGGVKVADRGGLMAGRIM